MTDVTVSGQRIRAGAPYQQVVKWLGTSRKIAKTKVRTERGSHRVICCQYVRDWACFTLVFTDDERKAFIGAYVLGGY